ncbi:MAG: hypothetical protein KGL46_08740 [Hyphomicrobiales bacterium]|nr:hypothetical protein [Hyphomicrobiales bacterium]
MIRKILAAWAPMIALAGALFCAPAGAEEAGRTPVPHPPKGQGEHCVADTEFMRRNHMKMLFHDRKETVHEGVRGEKFSLAGCVSCHAVKGADGKPVAFSSDQHFCKSCHSYAAVKIDCFECHASRPAEMPQKAASAPADAPYAAIASYVRDMKPEVKP